MPKRDIIQIDCRIFDERRLSDPQGVIDDLIAQTTRQGLRIHELTAELAEVRKDAMNLGSQLAEADAHVRELEHNATSGTGPEGLW